MPALRRTPKEDVWITAVKKYAQLLRVDWQEALTKDFTLVYVEVRRLALAELWQTGEYTLEGITEVTGYNRSTIRHHLINKGVYQKPQKKAKMELELRMVSKDQIDDALQFVFVCDKVTEKELVKFLLSRYPAMQAREIVEYLKTSGKIVVYRE